MIAERNTFLAGGLVLVLVAVSGWLARKAEVELAYQHQPHSPDYFLEGFVAISLGENGKPDKRLAAKRMVHYPDDDTTELTEPWMTVYDGEAPPWETRSETGLVSADGEKILLQGSVHIDRKGADGVRPARIVTRDLIITPAQEFAETTEDAFLQSGKSWIESKGMQVWFAKPSRVKLLAEVRGRYEIEQN
ncbi:MAG: LPS export ABC transporter periplasmic protein LptC [Gammaproteobacteria bacterium]|nr:LPS export ABC transporter periplasmic protein LptC [Gammaproteobacteria bacterium]